jgi:hypothetical protein
MISQKYSEEEQNNLNEIEETLNKSSIYVTIGPGEKALLQFLLGRKIEEVEKIYNGQTVKKIRFIVIDPNSGSNQEKFFDVGRRSALYIPTEVTG